MLLFLCSGLTLSSWKGLGETDETLVAKYAKSLDATLAIYDTTLSKQAYLAGDEITLADLFHLSLGKLLKEIGFPEMFRRYSNVTRWLDELSERPSWIKVNPDGIGLPTTSAGSCSVRPL
jgi:glutathione S-transferase